MNGKPVTVYIIDDEQDVRDALKMLVTTIGCRVEIYASALDFIEQFETGWPGCIIADIRMPGMSGIELQDKLKEMGAPIPVIVISGHADVPTAVRAIKKGALDLLEKPFTDQRLLDMVQLALNKDSEQRQIFDDTKQVLGYYAKLTSREKEIMRLVASGKMNKVIAHELNITTRTVELHRSRAMEKMQARSLADLIRYEQIIVNESK